MKYIKLTMVDAMTGISCNIQRPMNGSIFPSLSGLEVLFQDAHISEFWYAKANDDVIDDPDNQCWIISKSEFAKYLNDTIEKLKVLRLQDLERADREIRDELFGNYHITSVLAGIHKYLSACVYKNHDENEIKEGIFIESPNTLPIEADAREISVAELSDKIIKKYESFFELDAKISGIVGLLKDRIRSFNVDLKHPIASLSEFNKQENVNGIDLDFYGTDIMGRLKHLIS